jgi:hypothetical protein
MVFHGVLETKIISTKQMYFSVFPALSNMIALSKASTQKVKPFVVVFYSFISQHV